jgi:hypothetical protein
LAERKRLQIGVIVSAETKQTVEAMARDSGQSQGQIVERLIEKALSYERMFERLDTTPERMAEQAENAILVRRGYRPVRTLYGIAWLPKTSPEVAAFVPWRPDEIQPEPVEIPPPPEPPSAEERAANIAKGLRDLEEEFAKFKGLVTKDAKK